MARAAQGERLSMLEAVRRWCAADLVRAVHDREAEFPVAGLKAVFQCHLGGGATSQLGGFELSPTVCRQIQDRLGPAWRALRADFCQRVSIGRILLDGIPSNSSGDPGATPIPLLTAAHSFIDLAANTVEGKQGVAWHDVTAALNTGAASSDIAPGESLPLEQAMLTWCDKDLADRYETAKIASELWHEVSRRDHSADNLRRYFGYSRMDVEILQEQWRMLLPPAEKALHADFRGRITDGRIQLSGLQIAPSLAPDRTDLSPAWASRMQFEWRTQKVRVEGVIFADVEATQQASEPKRIMTKAAPKRRRGRPGFPMQEIVAIARSRLGVRLDNNQMEALALLSEFQRLHPSARPPGDRTVRDHLAEIYDAAATDTVPLKSPK